MPDRDGSAGHTPVGRPGRDPIGPAATLAPGTGFAGAQRFLSPALWRQLTEGSPRRGVLLNAQERLRSLLFLLGTYLPDHLVQQKMRRPVAGQMDGRLLDGAFLFADVSGFTALSEQLAVHPDGAERLTRLINAYMTTMLDVLSRSGGVLTKFAGDALLAYFAGYGDTLPVREAGAVMAEADARQRAAAQAAARAARAALRMMDAMRGLVDRSPAGTGALRIKIGIGTGSCLAAAVGDAGRMEYFLLGGAVARTMAAESHAAAGQVVGDAVTARLLAAHKERDGRWQVAAVDDDAAYYTLRLISPEPAAGAERGRGGTRRQHGDGPADFEVPVRSRRARGALPWGVSHHAVAAQMEVVVRQIDALLPFLAPELQDRIIAGAARRRVESEYRPTVVMFVNVAGPEEHLPPDDTQAQAAAPGAPGTDPSTSRADPSTSRADPSTSRTVRDVTRLLDGYFRAMHAVISDHGGVVARVDPYGSSTKMLVLFGAPVAHEDDAARAVGAALAMNEALATLNARWQRRAARSRPQRTAGDSPAATAPDRDRAPGVVHRIGITRGLTFAGQAGSNTRREYTVMGDDVNLAARLMGAAQWGQILVSSPVRDHAADRFVFGALEPIRVKGKREPVKIFDARAECADAPPERETPGSVLVGRDAELAAAQRALDAALAGQGGVLAITGAAGVGKSCLARALAACATQRGARVQAVECRAYAAPPYAPWSALLHALLDVPAPGPAGSSHGAARPRRLLAALARIGVDAAQHAPALGTLMGISMADEVVVSEASGRQRAAAGPTLFARLEKQIEAGDAPRPAQGTKTVGSVDLWQLAGTRQAQGGRAAGSRGDERIWQRLQERVASRQQARLAEALAECLRRASTAIAPIVLLLDHAQWLDDASRALLDLLPRPLAGARVLVVVVGRQEGDATRRPPTGRDEECADPEAARQSACCQQEIRLDALDSAATARLARHWLGQDAVDDALAAVLYRHSGGNPLFLQELVRAGCDVKGSVQDTLEYFSGLVLSRVDALPTPARAAIRAAAVAGDVFRQSEVDVLLGTTRAPAAAEAGARSSVSRDALSSLVAGDLLSGGKDRDDPVYTFCQALVREAIYRSHSFARRRELHGALAAHLANLAGTEVALLAHHYELAGQAQPAARYLLESARGARARYAYGRAASDCRRALAALAGLAARERTPAVAALEEALRVEQGDAHLLAGDLEAAAAAYGAAVAPYAAPVAGARGPGARQGGGAALPARLAWRLALALAGCGRRADALLRAELAWAGAAEPREATAPAGEAEPEGALAAIDRLALAATAAWISKRAGDRQAQRWIECMRSLAGETGRGRGQNGSTRRRPDAAPGVERLVALVEEMAAGGDEGDAAAVLFSAVSEVYDALPGAHSMPGGSPAAGGRAPHEGG